MTKTKFYVLLAIGVIGFGVWAAMAFIDPVYRADFMHMVQASVIGVIGLALRESGNLPPPSAPTAPAVVPTVPAAPAEQPPAAAPAQP